MKLLFDQNISYRIIKSIKEVYPDSLHISSAGLSNASDIEIWNFAKEKHFSIVTFDVDYVDILTVKSFPPKIILLKMVNQRTEIITQKIIQSESKITHFIDDADLGILNLT